MSSFFYNLCIAAFALGGSLAVAGERPNVLFIFLDDFGWKDTSHMGSDFYETPHLDALAEGGMTFTNAYSCAANCAPARACLLSGQYTSWEGRASAPHVYPRGYHSRSVDSHLGSANSRSWLSYWDLRQMALE